MPRASAGRVPFSQVAMLQPVIAYFEAKGICTEKYLAMADLGHNLFETSAAPIPTTLIFRFIQLVCSEEGIEDIGLLAGQSISVQMLGELGQRLLRAETIGDYLRLGCQMISKSASGDYYWLVEEGAGVRFCVSVAALHEPDAIQNYLYILLVTLNTIRQALGRPWCPAELTVPGISATTALKLSAIVPATRILGNGTFASFTIEDDVLCHPMSRAATRAPEQISATSGHPIPTDLRAAIGQVVEHLILSSRPDIHTAAEIVGLNPRTLQRRLAEFGTHFSGLVAERRVAIACRWIREGGRSFTDIARTLGYTDPANFSRAFRRIKGMSPRAYRDGLRRIGTDGSND